MNKVFRYQNIKHVEVDISYKLDYVSVQTIVTQKKRISNEITATNSNSNSKIIMG